MAKKIIVVENNEWSFAESGLLGGFIDYNDTSTSATPITLVADTWTTIPNDGLGAFSNDSYKPDLDSLACTRITSLTSRSRLDGKRSEAHQRHTTAFRQRASNRTNRCVKRATGRSFGKIRVCGNGVNQVIFVHVVTPRVF